MMAEVIGSLAIGVPIAYALGASEIRWRLSVSKRLDNLENERKNISCELRELSDKLDNCPTREELTWNYESLAKLMDTIHADVKARLDDLSRRVA
jgi:chromosome segregation ATPase